jgi:acetolactate synthase small subunit
MVQINLNIEEAEMMKDILSDLRMEVADTDRKDFREELKKKEVFVKNLLQQLKTD